MSSVSGESGAGGEEVRGEEGGGRGGFGGSGMGGSGGRCLQCGTRRLVQQTRSCRERETRYIRQMESTVDPLQYTIQLMNIYRGCIHIHSYIYQRQAVVQVADI